MHAEPIADSDSDHDEEWHRRYYVDDVTPFDQGDHIDRPDQRHGHQLHKLHRTRMDCDRQILSDSGGCLALHLYERVGTRSTV